MQLIKTIYLILVFSVATMGFTQAAPMAFTDFIKISRGMKETKVIDIAGQPDYVTDNRTTKIHKNHKNQSAQSAQVPHRNRGNYTDYYIGTKEMVWYADGYGSYTTTITIRDGRVSEIERKKKL